MTNDVLLGLLGQVEDGKVVLLRCQRHAVTDRCHGAGIAIAAEWSGSKNANSWRC